MFRKNRKNRKKLLSVAQFIIIKRAAPTGPSLPALLRHFQAFDEIGGLAIHWQLFGSSGHTTRPSGGVLQVMLLESLKYFTSVRPCMFVVQGNVPGLIWPWHFRRASQADFRLLQTCTHRPSS